MEDDVTKNNDAKGTSDLVQEVQALKERIIILERECDENMKGWQRAKADFVNYKKDESVRIQEMVRFGSGRLIFDMLGILDSFDLALQNMKDEETRDGVSLIKNQFEETLKRHGVQKITAEYGESLDLLKHEPLLEVESELSAGLIVELMASGFSLFDKVIRPAKVSISKGQT